MDSITAIFSGAGIGLAITVPVGPMAILCVNRTLNGGLLAGLSTGAGASTVQAAYAGVVLLGLQQVGPFVATNRGLIALFAALLMLLFAWRMLRARPKQPVGSPTRSGSILGNYLSAVLFNSSNPMLLVFLLGSVAAVLGPEPLDRTRALLVLTGIFGGSLSWWTGLTGLIAAVRTRLSAGTLQGINAAGAAVMIGFSVLALARAIGSPT